MGMDLRRLTAEDFDECVSLMNRVFSEGRTSPMDMARELPKGFASREAFTAPHWGIYENGRMVATAGYYPYDLSMNGRVFRCASIGNIVTVPECRGKGFMKALMTEATARFTEGNVALSRLGGMRLRYNRYGYENAGTLYRFTLTAENVKERVSRENYANYSFLLMENAESARELYATLPCRVLRPDAGVFRRVLESHFMKPYAIQNPDGSFAGYITAAEDGGQVGEIVMAEPRARLFGLCGWIAFRQIPAARIGLNPWEIEDIRQFSGACEHFSVDFPSMFRVMDWVGIADALIKLKRSYCGLPNGEAAIRIGGYGTILLRVDGGAAECGFAPGDRMPDLELDPLAATRFLFGPHAPYMVAEIPGNIQAALSSWLPLPLSWFSQDNI